MDETYSWRLYSTSVTMASEVERVKFRAEETMDHNRNNIHNVQREKGKDLTQIYDKNPTSIEKSRKQRVNTKTPPKSSIKQQLRIG